MILSSICHAWSSRKLHARQLTQTTSLRMVAQDFPRLNPTALQEKYLIGNARPNDATPATPSSSSSSPSSSPLCDPVIVGIAGGSASGKTTLARAIIKEVGEEHISFIGHDNYYKDLRHLTMEERGKVNFDHPDSLDTQLLCHHLRALKAGQVIATPTYDFTTHSRATSELLIEPRKIILVDGILIFAEPDLVGLMDMKIFVDTDDDIRLIRRIQRDTVERGRNVQQIIDQYVKTVRPMHQIYVEPSKRKADIIVPAGHGIQPVALDMCVSRLREIINFYQ